MPWKPSQQRAIAADLRRKGKSPEEIRRFFHRHGHGGKPSGGQHLVNAAKSQRKRRKS